MITIDGRYFMDYDYEDEQWKPFPKYKKYMVSNYCRVRNVDGKILKPFRIDHQTKSPTFYTQVYHKGKVIKFRLFDLVKRMRFPFMVKISYSNDKYLTYNKADEYIYGSY
jgi:hypothetical protein